jgi:hypothetical protein
MRQDLDMRITALVLLASVSAARADVLVASTDDKGSLFVDQVAADNVKTKLDNETLVGFTCTATSGKHWEWPEAALTAQVKACGGKGKTDDCNMAYDRIRFTPKVSKVEWISASPAIDGATTERVSGASAASRPASASPPQQPVRHPIPVPYRFRPYRRPYLQPLRPALRLRVHAPVFSTRMRRSDDLIS